MKYLKLFEDLGDEELYVEMTGGEFREKILTGDVELYPFTDSEFNRISSLTKSLYNGDWDCVYHQHIVSSPNGKLKTFEKSAIYIGTNEDMIIFKIYDEYFVVYDTIHDIPYKCDNIDGLEKCLTDIEF